MDDKPAYDINKLKKHEIDDPLVDDKPAYDINKLKKHETGDPLTNDKPAYDINKLKKHETGDPLTSDKSSYDIDKLKKHETGDPLVDDKSVYDINKLKKHESADLHIAKPEFELKNNDIQFKPKSDSEIYKNFIPIYTKQMRANTQIHKLVQPKENVSRSIKLVEEQPDKQVKKLPQAGTKQSLIPIILGAISTMLAGLGLTKRKKNK